MKRRTFTQCCLLLLLVLSIGSCKKDTPENNIKGTWQSRTEVTADAQQTYVLQFTFKSDGSFENKSVVLDKSKKLLGYLSKSSGDYTVTADKLTLTAKSSFYSPNGYSNESDLKEATPVSVGPMVYNLKYNNKKDSLTLTIGGCPVGYDCIVGPSVDHYRKVWFSEVL